MAESPIKDSQGPVSFTIYSEGNKISDNFGLISIWVRKEVNRIGKATLVFEAGNVAAQTMEESEDDTFAPGSVIRIETGYQGTENIIFEGIVTSHNVVVARSESAVLEIECRDFAFPATLGRKNRLFEKLKDNQVISNVLAEYSTLSVSVDSTNTKHNELVQYYCTDWDFILSRADANGLVVITEGKDISVKKPNVSGSAVLKITYGTDLIEFNGRLQTVSQMTGLAAMAWDSTTQKIIKVSGTSPSLNQQGDSTPKKLAQAVGIEDWNLQTGGCTDESELQSWADALLLRTGLARIQGDFKFQGSAKAVPGCIIDIDGLGNRFNGSVYVGSVEHEIKDGNWFTSAGIGISPVNITEESNVVSPLVSGLMPGINGLHIGKVTKLDEDPTTENKIQIEFPLLNGEKNTIWARLSNVWASNQYGTFFIPEIGDEVILGFLNNDPRYPVVLGSLYSSKQPPPYKIEADNKIKAIVTKSKLKITFEEEKKIITIETPGQNIIEINDDAKTIKLTDQNKNKIEMTSDGILIDSAKEIQLKAKTNINIEAGGNLSLKAKSNATMEGLKIEVKAQTEFTAKGNAKAELSASGQTVVKGAMVMIN
ncbi:type VI secretion system tip protein VgrG [Dysgonomonas sp. ZJ709]|uniref:type VI secretion system tip protein VgrG n=1 Tax=Dysgonomonas sp. ZJ709 TaxID=2709797 RepID=UPI0013EE247B|nr:type VI secretion system tip protein VgrG [Dysgonomonas sp. ZJ709]